MSLPELSNIDLVEANKNDESFGGCYSRDDLPDPLNSKYYIANLDSQSGSGTHWVLVDNRRSNECIYFDSYGMPPPEEILARMNQTGKTLVYNDANLQDLGSAQCGWWCEYIAEELAKGHSFRKVVAFAQNHKNPDKYLEKVFNKSKLPYKFNMNYFLLEQKKNGSGIISYLKSKINFQPRKWPTKRFENFLNQNGNKTIVTMKVGKQPIQSMTKRIMNWLSMGKFNKIKNELKYEDVYHNFLIVMLEDRKKWLIERKHVVVARPYHKNDVNETQMIWIPIPCDLTLNELINNASREDANFWRYDPEICNCQTFILDICRKNRVYIPQDIQEQIQPQNSTMLLNTLPKKLQKLPKLVTDAANVGDRLLFGDGLK